MKTLFKVCSATILLISLSGCITKAVMPLEVEVKSNKTATIVIFNKGPSAGNHYYAFLNRGYIGTLSGWVPLIVEVEPEEAIVYARLNNSAESFNIGNSSLQRKYHFEAGHVYYLELKHSLVFLQNVLKVEQVAPITSYESVGFKGSGEYGYNNRKKTSEGEQL